jgi:rhodanese-related sulfurtransferase
MSSTFWREPASSSSSSAVDADLGAARRTPSKRSSSVASSVSDDDEFKRLRRVTCAQFDLDDGDQLMDDDDDDDDDDHDDDEQHECFEQRVVGRSLRCTTQSPPVCASVAASGSSSSSASQLSLSLAPLHVSSPPPLASLTPLLPKSHSASSSSKSAKSRGSSPSSPSLSAAPDSALSLSFSPVTLTSPTHASPRDRLTAEFERHRADRRARAAVRQMSFADFTTAASTATAAAAAAASPDGATTTTTATATTSTAAADSNYDFPTLQTQPHVPLSRSIFSFEGSRRSRARRALHAADDDDASPTHSADEFSELTRARLTLSSAASFTFGGGIDNNNNNNSSSSGGGGVGGGGSSLGATGGDSSMLPAISPDAAAHLLLGSSAFLCGSESVDLFVIDCRFPYEYNGGHIAGAVNLFTKNDVERYFFGGDGRALVTPETGRRRIFLFHCEFSSHRGPAMLRHVRAVDRRVNAHRYPLLSFPDLVLLAGGYVAFCDRFAPDAAARGRRQSRDSDAAMSALRRTTRSFVSANEPRSTPHASGSITPPSPTSGGGNNCDGGGGGGGGGGAMPDSFVLIETQVDEVREPVPLQLLFAPHEPPLYTPMNDRRFNNERREFMRASNSNTMRRSRSSGEFALLRR